MYMFHQWCRAVIASMWPSGTHVFQRHVCETNPMQRLNEVGDMALLNYPIVLPLPKGEGFTPLNPFGIVIGMV